MRKFQKALETLQQLSPEDRPRRPRQTGQPDPSVETSLGRNGMADASMSSFETLDRHQKGGIRLPRASKVGRQLHVDRGELIRMGLFPGADVERVIQQQFRRIKLPLVQTAFAMGAPAEEHANVIMIASDMPGAGKSFCSLNLAESIAMERDVGAILVDADVVKPGISEALGLHEEPGLTDYIIDPGVRLEDIMVPTDLGGLTVIPSGRRHSQSTELLASRRMQDLVFSLSRDFSSHVTIFDSPPLLLTSEAQVLARIVGQVVLVIESRVSSQESVARALDLLDRRKPINAIFNKSRRGDSGAYSSGQYAYHPYWSDSDESRSE